MLTEHWCELVVSDEPKKMSDTLVDYARPLIDRLPDDHTLEELKAVIEFAAFLWNAVAVEDIPQFVVHLSTKMPPRLRVPAPKALAVVRRMLTRKDLSFGDDHRLVVVVGPGSQGAAASNNLVAQQATCQVLHLDVGAVNLNVLGLQVTTLPIAIDLSGDSAAPLGNLVCTILDTLNNVVGLVDLLNQLLGMLTGLVGGLVP